MKLKAEILRDSAGRATTVKVKGITFTLQHSRESTNIIADGARRYFPPISDFLNMIYPKDFLVTVRGLNWYDRNPKSVGDDYDADITGVDAGTDRISYTVPADRICLVESISINVARTVAGAGNHWFNARWKHTPSGGSAKIIQTTNIYGNTVGEVGNWTLGGNLTLFEGDVITLSTAGGSAGGKVSVESGFKGTEFDA